jgi:hypothetical protein
MGNYFPVPVRYRMSASLDDGGEWGARLVGVFFIVMGILLVARPATSALRSGAALMFGALGVPFMTSGVDDPRVMIVVSCLLLCVGTLIVLRKAWAHWIGMALALVLFVPVVPYVTLAGLLIIYVLWRGRPRRHRRRSSA